jgi:hypothetical protein
MILESGVIPDPAGQPSFSAEYILYSAQSVANASRVLDKYFTKRLLGTTTVFIFYLFA